MQTDRGIRMRRNRIAIAVCGGLLLGVTSMSGGVNAARCGGWPDKVVTPDPATWASPGEVISFFNSAGDHHDPKAGDTPAGLIVVEFCQGPNVGD